MNNTIKFIDNYRNAASCRLKKLRLIMIRSYFAFTIIFFAVLLSPHMGYAQSCKDTSRVSLNIMVASSLLHVLGKLDDSELCHMGVELRLIAGSSSSLSRQIEQGFKADVFISANARWMDQLERQSLIAANSRIAFIGNSLVKVEPRPQSEIRTWTTGDPAHVPLGVYAREALINMGEWEALAPKIVPAMNARGAVALMQSGGVDMAILYNSDAAHLLPATMHKTAIAPSSHSPIQYEVAILTASSHAKSARAFHDHLRSPSVQALFKDYGFTALKPIDP